MTVTLPPPPAPLPPPPSGAPAPYAEDPAAARQARLAAGVSGLKRQATSTQRVERVLLYAGGIALPLGLVLILLGWYGAAHTPRLFEQVPYLISGGLLGAGLIMAGGFLYFSYWLTRLVYEGRNHTDQLIEAVARLEAAVAANSSAAAATNGAYETAEQWAPAPTAAPAVALAPLPTAQAAPMRPAGMLVATATGTMVHKPGCVIVEGREGLRYLDEERASASFKACRICDPFGEIA